MADIAQVEIRQDGPATTVVGGGTLDFTNVKEFEEGLKQASLNSDAVTVDLRSADFIDTAVVQDLARAAVTLLKRGLRLKLVVTRSGYPLEVVTVSGFERIMDIEIEEDRA